MAPLISIKHLSIKLLLSIMALYLLIGCEPSSSPEQALTPAKHLSPKVDDNNLKGIWLDLADAQRETLQHARALQNAVDALATSPTDEHLKTAQQQWLLTYSAFIPLRVLPHLALQQPVLLGSLEPPLNALDSWPIEPGFIDYIGPYLDTGLVNDITVPMNAQTLRHQHGLTADSDISLGFQTLAFLLWGEKGQRSVADFIVPKSSPVSLVDTPQARRRAYAKITVQLLIDDLGSVAQLLDNESNTRQHFSKLMATTQQMLWREALSNQINSLRNEWLASASQNDELYRNPFQAGTLEAWCQSVKFLHRQNQGLSLQLPTKELTTCGEQQELIVLASFLLDKVGFNAAIPKTTGINTISTGGLTQP